MMMANPMYAAAHDPVPQLQAQVPLDNGAGVLPAKHNKKKQVKLQKELQNLKDAGNASVKLSNFLKLLQGTAGERNVPPQNYFISTANYNGEAAEDSIALTAKFEITILKEKWTSIPLFPETVALLHSRVSYRPSSLMLDTATEIPPAASKSIESEAPEEKISTTHCVGVFKNSYCLVANGAGSYSVELQVLVPYATNRKTGMYLSTPIAATSNLTFKVPEKDVLIKIDPCLFSRAYSVQEENSEKKVIEKSAVDCRLPPSSSLSIQWTLNKIVDIKEEKVQEEVSATVEQNTLISIGDGVILLQTILSYTVISGQMSSFTVDIDPRIKIITVEGTKEIPVKKWDVVSNKTASEMEKSSASKLLVFLDYGVEKKYEFTIVSEMKFEESAAHTTMPVFNSLVSKEISRELGYIAIEPRTSVEVSEVTTNGVTTLDVKEVPDVVYDISTNPLIFAYKFTVPGYRLDLNIKKHADVGVLVAVVDKARYSVTVSESGQVMVKMSLNVRNTQKQYVRFTMPTTHEVWSTTVENAPVKPAIDDQNRIMIALKKQTKSTNSADAHKPFKVEFSFSMRIEAMSNRGTIAVALPSCDIPINHLFVQVFLPKSYKYGEFTGLREVKWFSSVMDIQYQQFSNNDDYDRLGGYQMDMMPQQRAVRGGMRRGIAPVTVDIPQVGQEYKFEQLLVAEKDISFSVPYKRLSKGSCSKRSVKRCGCC